MAPDCSLQFSGGGDDSSSRQEQDVLPKPPNRGDSPTSGMLSSASSHPPTSPLPHAAVTARSGKPSADVRPRHYFCRYLHFSGKSGVHRYPRLSMRSHSRRPEPLSTTAHVKHHMVAPLALAKPMRQSQPVCFVSEVFEVGGHTTPGMEQPPSLLLTDHPATTTCGPPGPARTGSRWDEPNSFFVFPAEIRNQIYDLVLQLPTSRQLYAGYYRQVYDDRTRRRQAAGSDQACPEPPPPPPPPQLHTPSILLVCRRIRDECLPVLRARTLVIDRIPPWAPGAPRPVCLTRFVPPRTLQSLRAVDLRVDLGRGPHGSAWIWTRLAEDLLDVLAASRGLARLRLVYRLFQTENLPLWEGEGGERAYHARLVDKVGWFQRSQRQLWARPKVTVEYWEVKDDQVFLIEMPGGHIVRRLGPCSDIELVPGSITDFLNA